MKILQVLIVANFLVLAVFTTAPANVLEDCTAQTPAANAGCTSLFPTPATDCTTKDQAVTKVC